MFTHVVTLVKERHIRQREIFDEHEGRPYAMYVYNDTPLACDDADDPDEIKDAMTWFFNNPAQALEWAKYISTVHPSYDAYVAETRNIVATEPAVPVVKTVTERGVLPA